RVGAGIVGPEAMLVLDWLSLREYNIVHLTDRQSPQAIESFEVGFIEHFSDIDNWSSSSTQGTLQVMGNSGQMLMISECDAQDDHEVRLSDMNIDILENPNFILRYGLKQSGAVTVSLSYDYVDESGVIHQDAHPVSLTASDLMVHLEDTFYEDGTLTDLIFKMEYTGSGSAALYVDFIIIDDTPTEHVRTPVSTGIFESFSSVEEWTVVTSGASVASQDGTGVFTGKAGIGTTASFRLDSNLILGSDSFLEVDLLLDSNTASVDVFLDSESVHSITYGETQSGRISALVPVSPGSYGSLEIVVESSSATVAPVTSFYYLTISQNPGIMNYPAVEGPLGWSVTGEVTLEISDLKTSITSGAGGGTADLTLSDMGMSILTYPIIELKYNITAPGPIDITISTLDQTGTADSWTNPTLSGWSVTGNVQTLYIDLQRMFGITTTDHWLKKISFGFSAATGIDILKIATLMPDYVSGVSIDTNHDCQTESYDHDALATVLPLGIGKLVMTNAPNGLTLTATVIDSGLDIPLAAVKGIRITYTTGQQEEASYIVRINGEWGSAVVLEAPARDDIGTAYLVIEVPGGYLPGDLITSIDIEIQATGDIVGLAIFQVLGIELISGNHVSTSWSQAFEGLASTYSVVTYDEGDCPGWTLEGGQSPAMKQVIPVGGEGYAFVQPGGSALTAWYDIS
ncbi:MAG: hypothetical protein ACFFER_05750, partial [Candidatus Thorarchaeota archaeon]